MLKSLRRLIHLPKLPWRRPKNKRHPVRKKSTVKQKKAIGSRKEKIKRRKNFLPSLLITIILWISLASVIYFVDPTTTGIIVIFVVLMFFCITFTASFLFVNTRIGLITGVVTATFLVLRYFGIGNALNAVLLVALAFVTEYYLRT